jgi:hypothetical protein
MQISEDHQKNAIMFFGGGVVKTAAAKILAK